MAIYKKVTWPDDVMTFCEEKKTMGKRFVAAKNANKRRRNSFYGLFPKVNVLFVNYAMVSGFSWKL